MRPSHGLTLGLALALLLAGCPAAKAPTTGVVAKPRPRASAAARPAAIPEAALAQAIQGLATRVAPQAPASTKLAGVVRIISDNGGGIISDNGGGIISNNSGAIVANNGGAIISDNGGGIVSDNGGGLVANNGGGLTAKAKYGLRQAPARPAAEFALADAVITFHDASGAVLTTPDGQPIVAFTDRTGAYRAELPLPPENVVLRVRLWNGGEVRAMAPKDGGADRLQAVDTATSLGAAYVLEKFVKGDQATYDKLPDREAAALRAAIAAAGLAADGAPTYERPALVARAEALRAQAPAVDEKLEDIRALLIGQVADGDGRPASEVALPGVEGMAVDAQGGLLLGEQSLGRIRRVRPDGTITTFADLHRGVPVRQNFTELDDLAPGPGGALYVASANSVWRLAPDGGVSKAAGVGLKGRAAAGGPAAEMTLEPGCLTVAADGTLYLADASQPGSPTTRILAVGADGLAKDVTRDACETAPDYQDLIARPDGTIVTLTRDNLTVRRWTPGKGSVKVADLPGGDAVLDSRLAVAPDGTIYVSLPHQARVVAVDPASGAVRTAAGADGPVGQALLFPSRLACGADGTLYVHDRTTGLVHALDPRGGWRAVAGTSGAVRADGDLTAIALNRPYGVAYAPDGSLVFSENGGYAVRRFAAGAITPVAGATIGDAGDGGPATAAAFRSPGTVARHGDTTWVIDEGNRRLRAIGPDGAIRTVVGGVHPHNVAAEDSGLKFLLAAGERVPPDRVLLDGARGLAIDAKGRPYWSMGLSGQIWRLADDGMVEAVAGVGSRGNLQIGLDVLTSLGQGTGPEPAASATLATPFGIAFDSKGDLYVAELLGFRVRRLRGLDGPSPTIELAVGRSLAEIMAFQDAGGAVGSVEGQGVRDFAPALPMALAVDAQDRLYVAYGGTKNLAVFSSAMGAEAGLPPGLPPYPPGVLRIEADGKAHHVAGPYARYFPDETAEDAMVAPSGLAIDAEGRLAIADFAANVLRILPPGTAK